MEVSDLGATVAVLLAVSLATERWVAVAKTVFPWLADERRTAAGEGDPVSDRPRRLAVQAVALAGAWLVAAFVAGGGVLAPGAFVGVVHAGAVRLPAPVVGLLASGGSAFWTQVVQLAGAVKDAAAARGASEALALRARAESLGVLPARVGRHPAGDRRTRLRMQLDARPPERLDALAGRT
jgi:hypothetical protein